MFLAEDKSETALVEQEALFRRDLSLGSGPPGGKWQNFPNSHIAHHGTACCDIAHEWLIAFDFAQLNGGDVLSGPRWLREHSTWGPTVWPIHWCEAVDAKIVDCGVHAAMAHEVFVARGVTVFRAQFVQRYCGHTAASWQQNWRSKGASDHWIDGEAIYHEGNAVLAAGDQVKLWDGSAGCWLNPRVEVGYGSLAALRIEAKGPDVRQQLSWGGRAIPVNKWVQV